MIQRILVIGATGLLGEPVARCLQDAGFSVRVLARQANRARLKFPEPFEVVEGGRCGPTARIVDRWLEGN